MYKYRRIIGVIAILTLAILIGSDYNIVFSSSTNGELQMENIINGNKDNPGDQNTPKEGSVELEGIIGEWDPNEGVSKKLNDLNEGAIDGKKPGEGEYFTIAATVPVSMDFGVYRSSNVVMGNFYSPNYKIINHGSKALDVKVGFDKGTITDNQTTLFIDKPSIGNGRVEIDLGLLYMQEGKKEVKVDLTEDLTSKSNRLSVGRLDSNEEAIVTFVSDNWEPISWEPQVTESVNFSGTIIFEFSY